MEIPVKLRDPEKIMALNREALSEWNGVWHELSINNCLISPSYGPKIN